MKTYAYIDASNLFYGGKKSLGWSVDFEKLFKYALESFVVHIPVPALTGMSVLRGDVKALSYDAISRIVAGSAAHGLGQ